MFSMPVRGRLSALLALAALRLVACQTLPPAPLPTKQTALWVNDFAAIVSLEVDVNETATILENALRSQYTAAGYAVDIINVQGCINQSFVPRSDGIMPATTSPGEEDALALPPVPLPEIQQDVLVRGSCYRLNVTLYFNPAASDIYLDAAAGTSGDIASAVRTACLEEGLQLELYLLGTTLLPGIRQVVSTGQVVLKILESGYRTTVWVSGRELVPVDRAQLVAMLAAVRAMGLEQATGLARSRLEGASQNQTGFGVTFLTIVRPTSPATSFPEAWMAAINNQSFVGVLRELGLPAESVTLLSISPDNATILNAQLSALLSSASVVSRIGGPGQNGTGGPAMITASPMASSSTISPGQAVGIAIGSLIAVVLVVLLVLLLLRRRQTNEFATKISGSTPPAPPPSAVSTSAELKWGGLPEMAAAVTAPVVTSLPILAWSEGSWQLQPESISICKRPDGSDHMLGRGTYGVVYKALLDGEREVAVKMLTSVDEWQLQQFRHEIDLLRSLPVNDNVVQFYGACLSSQCPFLVLEYMGGGDMREALSNPATAPLLDWHQNGQKIAGDVAKGLAFLHENNIIHADLKSKNVLLNADCSAAKIGDVGLSRVMQGSHASSCADAVGTFSYAAPEQILGYKLTPKVDSFAFSVLLWEMMTKEPPVRGQLHSIESPRVCPPEVKQLIEHGLSRNPKQRPSAQEACDIISAVGGGLDRDGDVDVVPHLSPLEMYRTW